MTFGASPAIKPSQVVEGERRISFMPAEPLFDFVYVRSTFEVIELTGKAGWD
jgi:hypothetical protein